ncbi:MAG: hypothetical protein K0Q63_156 [Paenibacillus sp.]|jgi:hypothetical protein|nr:hypothetical protein [Paenibacillus sp.]
MFSILGYKSRNETRCSAKDGVSRFALGQKEKP